MFGFDSGGGTPVTMHKLMNMDGPEGTAGKDTFRADAPGRLAEASLALRLGKMPTKLALIMANRSGETSLVLDGATWTISGMVPVKGDPDEVRRDHRSPRPGLDHRLVAAGHCPVDLGLQAGVDEGTLLERARHYFFPRRLTMYLFERAFFFRVL